MIETRKFRLALLFSVVINTGLPTAICFADEVSVFFGSGAQPGSEQRNTIGGIEYSFYTFARSARQHLQVGVSYSRWHSNSGAPQTLHSISVYPQLTFFPSSSSWVARSIPNRAKAFLFARMLGPTYISEPSLGERKQAGNFSFHAQLGAGLNLETRTGQQTLVTLSWRHLSNARLARPNDGIDVPLVVTLGVRF